MSKPASPFQKLQARSPLDLPSTLPSLPRPSKPKWFTASGRGKKVAAALNGIRIPGHAEERQFDSDIRLLAAQGRGFPGGAGLRGPAFGDSLISVRPQRFEAQRRALA